jgi:pyruvate formate lyase activating enzyme
MDYVYVGNILMQGAGDTNCPSCGRAVVRRTGYTVRANRLVDGRCPDCDTGIYGVWQ